MSIKDELSQHRDAILAIARRHGASRVRVFGSVARGTDGPDSDVDFLVHAETATLFDLVAMEEELEHVLGRRVQVVSEGGLKPAARDITLGEAVAV